MLLEICSTADVIDMTMGDERVFDLCGVESEFPQSADDLVLDRVGPDRIEQHDAFRGRQAQAEYSFSPTKYKLSNTFTGST